MQMLLVSCLVRIRFSDLFISTGQVLLLYTLYVRSFSLFQLKVPLRWIMPVGDFGAILSIHVIAGTRAGDVSNSSVAKSYIPFILSVKNLLLKYACPIPN